MSLCHGELGVLDTLAILAGTYNYRESEAALQQYTARLYALLNTFGPRCGTPNEVVSPGLLTGLAGIGYGLLRIAFPQQVPSVLAFESSRTVN